MEPKRKTVWILNHYATITMFDHGGRHHAFARHLLAAGYDVKVFCASTVHASDRQLITDARLYEETVVDGIPFVVVRTHSFAGNGGGRVRNMLDFFFNMLRAAGHFPAPDVVIGSSVHPLACVDAILLGRRFGCRSIAEIRDLWPDSIVAYTGRKKSSPIIRLLYLLERWIYVNADALVFTMPGGRDYIVGHGMDVAHGGRVDLDKVYYINNGVDLALYTENCRRYTIADPDLDDPDTWKAVYVGTVSTVNRIDRLVEVAGELAGRGADGVRILVYGDGLALPGIREAIRAEGLTNIVCKGRVDKTYIPYILSKCDLNLMQNDARPALFTYGASLNKSFDYLASGKPTLASFSFGYDYISGNGCGVCEELPTAQAYADAILRFADMPEDEYAAYCGNAARTARAFDFPYLTERLIAAIEGERPAPQRTADGAAFDLTSRRDGL